MALFHIAMFFLTFDVIEKIYHCEPSLQTDQPPLIASDLPHFRPLVELPRHHTIYREVSKVTKGIYGMLELNIA